MEIFTIGVYNSTEKEFFNKLINNQIDTFCDIRQRRGVRGSKYAFVNSNRLQQRLLDFDIKYGYVQGLAPTSEIRGLQKEIDLEKGELKSQRHELGKVFIIEYKNKILQKFNFEIFFDQLENAGANKIVLFCVEEFAEACHRSIVANWIKDKYNLPVTNL